MWNDKIGSLRREAISMISVFACVLSDGRQFQVNWDGRAAPPASCSAQTDSWNCQSRILGFLDRDINELDDIYSCD